MTIRTLSVGDSGLDLVLGGGIAWVERVPGHQSATVVVRGGAGTGKTLTALHLSHALARTLEGDVAYACVELLPMELVAQARSLFADKFHYGPVSSNAQLGAPVGPPCLLPGLLELPENGASIGSALESFWAKLTAGPKGWKRPKVLVVDSLIDGYGLGSNVPRQLADAMCKLAAEWNVVLILVEEVLRGDSSPWVFACDTAIELESPRSDISTTLPAPTERRLTVLKHRFLPSDAGPHRFQFVADKGLSVAPRPSAWIEPWAKSIVLPRINGPLPNASVPLPTFVLHQNLASFGQQRGHVVFIHDADAVRCKQHATQTRRANGQSNTTLSASFHLPLGTKSRQQGGTIIGLAHPYASPHKILHAIIDAWVEMGVSADHAQLVVGDLCALGAMAGGEHVLLALGVLATLARQVGTLLVLYETTPPRLSYIPGGHPTTPFYFDEPGIHRPPAAAFADVIVEGFGKLESYLQQSNMPFRLTS